jgi:hypothetical protein
MNQEYVTKSDLTEAEARLDQRIDSTRLELLERLEKVETTLLTEFHKYAQSSERRISLTEQTNHSLADRLGAVETRVRELEKKAAGLQ